MRAHIDLWPSEDCVNDAVIGMCHKCNKCGRFDEKEEQQKESVKMRNVFKMNECVWVVAETKKRAVEWYKNETGINEEKHFVKEANKEKEGITQPLKNPLDYRDNEYFFRKILKENDEIKARIIKGKNETLYLIIPYSEIIKKENAKKVMPYIISIAEC